MLKRTIKRCREYGMTYQAIASVTPVSYTTVRRWCDSKAAEQEFNYRREDTQEKNKYRYRVLQRYKQLKGCSSCGYNTHGVALQFDHLPGQTKSFTISSSMSRDFNLILAEIDKCQVLCANCHAVTTHLRNQ